MKVITYSGESVKNLHPIERDGLHNLIDTLQQSGNKVYYFNGKSFECITGYNGVTLHFDTPTNHDNLSDTLAELSSEAYLVTPIDSLTKYRKQLQTCDHIYHAGISFGLV